MTGSSTRQAPEPWIPDIPDNEPAVMDAVRQYKAGLAAIARTQGIPGLMAELTRINEAQQRLAASSLTSSIQPSMQTYVDLLDRVTPRSRPTESRPDSARGRGAVASPTSPRPGLLPVRSRSGALDPGAARRIAAAQVRAEMRERGI